jgi:hypothetical protein
MCVCVYLHNNDPTDFISFVCMLQITSATGGQFQAFFATPTCQQIQG